jgi:CRP-like cAMP-binding protein
MISPEVLRRYSFFGGLNQEQLATLAKACDELAVAPDVYFFDEGDSLDHLYLVLEGSVAVVIAVPDESVEQPVSGQLTGTLTNRDVVIGTLGPGEAFGWSALVPPNRATSSAKATTGCRVATFDRQRLAQVFEDDPAFGYLMMQHIARVISDRLHAIRIESLEAFKRNGAERNL